MHANQLSPLFPCPQPSRWPSQQKPPIKYSSPNSPGFSSAQPESFHNLFSNQAFHAYPPSANAGLQSVGSASHWHVATPHPRFQMKPELSPMGNSTSSVGFRIDVNSSLGAVWPKMEFPYSSHSVETIRPNDLVRPLPATRSNSQEPSVSSSCDASDAMQMDDMDGVDNWNGHGEVSAVHVGRIHDLAGIGYHEPCQLALSPEPMGGSSNPRTTSAYSPYSVPPSDSGKIKREHESHDPWIDHQHSHDCAESGSGATGSGVGRTDEHDTNKWCPLCEKTFSRAFNYRSHMATHNPNRERNHVCRRRGCNKAFFRPTDLKRHEQSVHLRLREWRCKQCNSCFPRKDSLTRHQYDGCVQQKKMVIKQEPSQSGLSKRFQTLQVQRTSYPEEDPRKQEDEYFVRPSADLPMTRSRA